ncbi:MAG: family 1 glycosylhydrolase [Capsulimonadaceae bacterium]|nr:family 1 glycosylhydrolase [Capsulimonadaceae bacterium]
MYDVFSLPEIKFPDGFLWGAATAGHQIEGDNVHSQCWAGELAGGFRETSGKACNHYEMYRDDVALIRELGHQAYRMSIEWCRIEPTEGCFDEKAMEHYLDELRLLKQQGTYVLVTLHHGSHPQWFDERGAFQRIENLGCFERYLEYLAPKIAPYVDNWHTLNEPNGAWPISREMDTARTNKIKFHARAYRLVKSYSDAPVSYSHCFMQYMPKRHYNAYDNLITNVKDFLQHETWFHAIRTGELLSLYGNAESVPEVKGSVDYWGVNAYTRHMVDARIAPGDAPRFKHKELKMIAKDFYLEEMYPEGMTANLERLTDKPVYITENGCACDDDRFRIVYIALYLSAIREAIDLGVDVRGYFYWSFMDNYEWSSFLPRFGLVHVDFETFERTPKPSAYFYRDVIAQNGVTPELISRYLSELPTLSRRDRGASPAKMKVSE